VNEIATVPQQAAPPMLTDLRGTIMQLSVPNMEMALGEFTARRNAFRLWLMEQMKLGTHYGVPPGCEPRKGVNPDQWTAKPSLYKSGADFLCDLMGWRSVFDTDVTTWEMLGKPEAVCMQCTLVDSQSNEVGQGRGARRKGEKSMEINATIKMAEKCAKVNAVINALSLSDMFTQDLEDLKPKHVNPVADETQPKQQPRSERVTGEELVNQKKLWESNNQGLPVDAWREFVSNAVQRDFDIKKPGLWTREDFDRLKDAVSFDVAGAIPEGM
jgi:hypothetical protein